MSVLHKYKARQFNQKELFIELKQYFINEISKSEGKLISQNIYSANDKLTEIFKDSTAGD